MKPSIVLAPYVLEKCQKSDWIPGEHTKYYGDILILIIPLHVYERSVSLAKNICLCSWAPVPSSPGSHATSPI